MLFRKLFFTYSITALHMIAALPKLTNPNELHNLFPSTVSDVVKFASRAEMKYQSLLDELIKVPQEKDNFEKILSIWDTMEGEYQYSVNVLDAVSMCSPDTALRNAASKAEQQLKSKRIASLYKHPEFYDALSAITSTSISEDQKYFFDQVREKLKRNGFQLSGTTRDHLRQLFSEAYTLEEKFSKNIIEDNRYITASKMQLNGLSSHVLDRLSKTKEGKYILTTDYPVFFPVLNNCQEGATRKALHEVFVNKGYPHNQKVLDKLIRIRAEIAKSIGYDSYAEMEIKTEMIQTPENARSFLVSLAQKVMPKATQEISTLQTMLPKNIHLTKDGKINEWDLSFVIENAKRHLYQVSNDTISEYFPLESTIVGLVRVYEKFFNIHIDDLPAQKMWSDDIYVLRVSEKGSRFLHGYILLDLHPRPNKYGHACMIPLLPGYNDENRAHPASTLLICNFPRDTKDAPALLSHSDVITFFHEFGHALHHLFGRSTLTSATLDEVATDFVELPSQLLEEWMWDKEILRRVSRHYKTGLALPEELVDKMIEARQLTIGLQTEYQCALSLIALSLFGKEPSDPNLLFNMIHEEFYPHVAINPKSHRVMSFSHLQNYGSRYYGYLWSRIIASDIFETIKKQGLLNPEVGIRYRNTILKPAATKDPNEMIRAFLEREPSNEAFLRKIGVYETAHTM